MGCRFTGPTPCWQKVLASTSVYIHLHKTCCVFCVLSLMDVLVQCVVFTVVDPSLLLFPFTTCLLQWWPMALSSVPTRRLERPWAELDSDRGQVPVPQSFLFCGKPLSLLIPGKGETSGVSLSGNEVSRETAKRGNWLRVRSCRKHFLWNQPGRCHFIQSSGHRGCTALQGITDSYDVKLFRIVARYKWVLHSATPLLFPLGKKTDWSV